MSELTDKKIIFDSNVVLGDGTGSTVTLDALLSASAQEVADPTKDTATIYFTGGAGEPKIVVNGADYTGYHKPTNGIPYADLDSSVKEKLDDGDAVYAQLYDQKVSSWSLTTSNERFPSEKLVKDSLDAKAPLVDAALTGIPTAPLANGNNASQIANVAFVNQAIGSITGALIYKGTIEGGSPGSEWGNFTQAANRGWTYKVSNPGKIDGVVVETGDMLICTEDNTPEANASNVSGVVTKWNFIQANETGVVTGPSSATNGAIALFDGVTGKIIKDSNTQIDSLLGTNETYHYSNGSADRGKEIILNPGGVQQIITKINRDSRNHLVGVETQNLPTYSLATQNATGLMSAADKTKLDGIETGAQAHKAPTATEIKDALGVVDQSGNAEYAFTKDGHWTYNNYASSNDTSSKIYLIGATSQGDAKLTYSQDTAYVGTDGCLYSNNTKVKVEQSAFDSDTVAASGYETVFISKIQQNAQGQVSIVKKTLPLAVAPATGVVGNDGLMSKEDKALLSNLYWR